MDDHTPTPGSLRALIVDDEPAILRALGEAMEMEHWKVTTVASGEEALRGLEEVRPHVIVADKNMPGMSGVELLRRVRDVEPEIAFVLITGYGNVESLEEVIQLDVDGYIEKPFRNIFDTVRLIESCMERRRDRARFRRARSHFRRATERPEQVVRPKALLALEDPLLRSRLSEMLFEKCDFVEAPEVGDAASIDLVVADATTMAGLIEKNPNALTAVVTESRALAELLQLVDGGASAVVNPDDGDDEIRRELDRLIKRTTC